MTYSEDEYLALSGIQHFCYCRRQWALIHMEQLWADDSRTAAGKVFHENVDGYSRDRRKELSVARSLRVSSKLLGLTGICDVVEFLRTSEGYQVDGMKGRFIVRPIEYKVGRRKPGLWDRVQLCAEAMAIEESLNTVVESGALFYGQERRREEVPIDAFLRGETCRLADEMHSVFESETLPQANEGPICSHCSLRDLCVPGIGRSKSVDRYMSRMCEEE